MEDPRVAVLMEHIDARQLGELTPTALIARRVASILDFVKGLRVELMRHSTELVVLEEQFVNLGGRVKELEVHHKIVSEIASVAVMRLMKTTNQSLRVQFRKIAQTKQKNLDEFEADYQVHQERYRNIKQAFESKREVIKVFLDEIPKRMDTVDELLKSANISWPSYYFDYQL